MKTFKCWNRQLSVDSNAYDKLIETINQISNKYGKQNINAYFSNPLITQSRMMSLSSVLEGSNDSKTPTHDTDHWPRR